jgi:hypothetical protein
VFGTDAGKKGVGLPREPTCSCDGQATNRRNLLIRQLFMRRFEQHEADASVGSLVRTGQEHKVPADPEIILRNVSDRTVARAQSHDLPRIGAWWINDGSRDHSPDHGDHNY